MWPKPPGASEPASSQCSFGIIKNLLKENWKLIWNSNPKLTWMEKEGRGEEDMEPENKIKEHTPLWGGKKKPISFIHNFPESHCLLLGDTDWMRKRKWEHEKCVPSLRRFCSFRLWPSPHSQGSQRVRGASYGEPFILVSRNMCVNEAMQSQWVGCRLLSLGHTSNSIRIAVWTRVDSMKEPEAKKPRPWSHLPSENPLSICPVDYFTQMELGLHLSLSSSCILAPFTPFDSALTKSRSGR